MENGELKNYRPGELEEYFLKPSGLLEEEVERLK